MSNTTAQGQGSDAGGTRFPRLRAMTGIGLTLSVGVLLIATELLGQGRRWPRVDGWWGRAILLNGFQAVSVFIAGNVWDPWMSAHRLWSADSLGTVGGAIVGYVAITLVYYWWHRVYPVSRTRTHRGPELRDTFRGLGPRGECRDAPNQEAIRRSCSPRDPSSRTATDRTDCRLSGLLLRGRHVETLLGALGPVNCLLAQGTWQSECC